MRWVLAALSLAACAEVEKPPTGWATLDGSHPLVIAHRGASGRLPEHTLEAYALAIDMGADVIEPDLVFTKDGVLVARHDRYLSTTTDVADHTEFANRRRANDDPGDTPRLDWWIEDFTLAELKFLRARQPFPGRSKEFDGLYEIPTFDQILALAERKSKAADRPVGVYPETKHPAFFASIGHDFEEPLLTALKRYDSGPVFIQSFEPEILKRLKGKTTAKLVQLVYVRPIKNSPEAPTPNILLEEIATYADGVGAEKRLLRDFIAYSGAAPTSDFVASAHALALFVHAWTYRDDQTDLGMNQMWAEIGSDPGALEDNGLALLARQSNSVPEFELLHDNLIGVDGVFSDFPDTAVRMREKAGEVDARRR